MSEPAERIAVPCPSCSPAEPAVHEVLAPGGTATVRCTVCRHTHKVEIPEERTVERSVIVSQDGESFRTSVEAPPDEQVTVGEEFVVDSEEALLTVRITDLQVGRERREKRATVEEVETFWTRAVDNVAVPVTVNPIDGRHDGTRSLDLRVPGDYEFTVGEDESLADERFRVKSLLLREDARGYDFEQLDHEGDVALAKDLQRVYADAVGSRPGSAWSGW
jgi:uncharacterized Zn finger protein